MAQTANVVQLKPQTRQAFDAYIREAETGMAPGLDGSVPFLWSDASSTTALPVRQGEIVAQFWSGEGPINVPDGLIHDWVGAAFTSGTTVKETLVLIQDYNNHKSIYKPEVIESKLLSQHDNDFQIYLRLLKKKIITVVLDTDHDVHYSSLECTRWFCRSYTTRVAEVEDPGRPNERVLPPDTGYGFLWRLYSYWRLQERAGGLYV